MTRFLIFLLSFPAPLMAEKVDFAHEVMPLLQTHCVECHGGDEAEGGFSVNTRALVLEADVIEPGDPDNSILMELVLSDDEDERMPPPDDGKPALTEAEIDVLSRWITAEVPWEDGFTFATDRYEPPLKPRPVTLPGSNDDRNPLDRIALAYFDEHHLSPPAAAADEVFLRRLWLDIVGLPPSAAALQLLKEPSGLDRDAAIEMVFADEVGYAEHWLTFWNDLLRNDYIGPGYTGGTRRQITGWLYQSLLENKPYDQFVRELIAPTETSEGFISGIKWRGRVNASQTREIQFSQNISQAFLGINMKCASCHDSFVDRWTLKEAYGLAAIYSTKPLELNRCDIPTGEMAKPAWIYPELGQIDPDASREKRLEQLADLMTHPENGRMQRTIANRLWKRLMGRGIVHPVDAMNSEPWSEDMLDYLANHLVASDYDMKAVLLLIASSEIYQAKTEIRPDEGGEYLFRGPVRKRMTAEQFIDSIRNTTGVWPEPRENAFKEGTQEGQLLAVMKAHKLDEWDNRPIRTGLTNRDRFQASLGRPNREQIVSSRPGELTTLEAINLANGADLTGLIRQGARELAKSEVNKTLVDHVYLTTLSRMPTHEERAIARQLLGSPTTESGREDFLWMVFMLPEFLYVN